MLALVAVATAACKKQANKPAMESLDPSAKQPPVVPRAAKGAEKAKETAAAKAGDAKIKAPEIAKADQARGGERGRAAALPAEATANAAAKVAPAPAAAVLPATPPAPAVPATAAGSALALPTAAPPPRLPPEVRAKVEEIHGGGDDATGGRPAGGGLDRHAPEAAPEAPRVAEAARPVDVPSGEPPLDIMGYVSIQDLELVIGGKVKFRRADLVGVAPSPNYNALFYEPEKGDQFGVALQVWRDPNVAESRTRFNTMRNTYSNVVATKAVTEQGFRSFYGNVVTLAFAHPTRPIIAAISCGKICTADMIIELASRVSQRLR